MARRNIDLPVLLLLFFFAGFVVEKSYAKSLEVGFIGNSAFYITDGEYVIFKDFPYKSGAYGYMEYDFDFSAVTGNILSLISHRHVDHFDPLLFTAQNWKIIAPREVTVQLEQNKIIKFEDKITYGPITVRPKKSRHANTAHYSYLVTWGGRKLYFTGDTEALDTLKDLPELDALFITPWFYRKARINDMLPESKKTIIYHHRANDIIPDCIGCIIPKQNQMISLQ